MYPFGNLYEGILIKRYKRFFADIQVTIKGKTEILVAHNPNTGSMRSLLNNNSTPIGYRCLYSISDNPNRKLPYTLEFIEVNNEWVMSNTNRVNAIVESAIKLKELDVFKGVEYYKREYCFLDSRIDFYLEIFGRPTLMEVKSVTYFDDKSCYFPDAVTSRGTKHLNTLSKALDKGYHSIILYVCMVKRNNFAEASWIDPNYFEASSKSESKGVKKIILFSQFNELSRECSLINYL